MKKLLKNRRQAILIASALLLSFVAVDFYKAQQSNGLGNYGSDAANQAALTRNPDDPVALRGVGEYERMTRDYEKALMHFQAALRLEPNNSENQFNVAYTLGRMGRDQEALAAMQKAAQGDGIAGDGARKLLAKMQNRPHALADKKWIAGDRTIRPEVRQVRPNSDMKKEQ